MRTELNAQNVSRDLCVCVCVNRDPGRAIWLNYEVVVFQAWVRERSILSTLPLLIVNNFSLPDPSVSVIFWIILFLLLPPPPISCLQLHFTDLSHLLPTSSPGVDHRPPRLSPHPTPTSLRRSSLCPASRAWFRRNIPRPFTPPFPPSACAQVLVGPWGVVRCLSLRLRCVPAYLPLLVNRRLPSSSGVWFHSSRVDFSRAKTRGPGASTPWQLIIAVLTLFLQMSLLAPFRLPGTHPLTPSTTPYVVSVSSPLLMFVGRSASCNVWIWQSSKRLLSFRNQGPSGELYKAGCVLDEIKAAIESFLGKIQYLSGTNTGEYGQSEEKTED